MAMTGGFVLGERQRDVQRANGGGQISGDQQSPSPSPAFTPPGDFCPEETLDTARKVGLDGDLWQVLKIYTDNDSTYWICTDAKGALYYQGKTGGIDAKLVEGDNGLFLKNVRKVGTDTYEVYDQRGNRFVITPSLFELTFAKVEGKPQRKPQRNAARRAG
uniref:hypothetical protein n=1 Tax=Paractinoplanes polyasparticus TaxID=2856853 RepID=UPI001C857BEB|nr:hypothetical protein [Actinoplanes polyasparticus]